MQLPYDTRPAPVAAAVARRPVVMYGRADIVPVTSLPSAGGITSRQAKLLASFAPGDVDALLVARLLVVGPASSAVAVYVTDGEPTIPGAVTGAAQVDLTHRGDGDLASYDPPLVVARGQQLVVVWDSLVTQGGAVPFAFARLELAR